MAVKATQPGPVSRDAAVKIVGILLREGWTVAQIATSLGRSYVTVYGWIRKYEIPMPPRSGRRQSKKQRAEIRRLLMSSDLSHKEIAERVGCSKHSVWLRAEEMRKKQTDKAGDFQPKQSNVAKRCPVHGLVTVWPCVACAALSGQEAHESKSE